jgi:hypothetical protein
MKRRSELGSRSGAVRHSAASAQIHRAAELESSARLVIATGASRPPGSPWPPALAGWLRPWRTGMPAVFAATRIVIEDLDGQRILALPDARPRLELLLPPGTYHVSLEGAGMRRRYTVTLQAGTTFELRLVLDGWSGLAS